MPGSEHATSPADVIIGIETDRGCGAGDGNRTRMASLEGFRRVLLRSGADHRIPVFDEFSTTVEYLSKPLTTGR